MPIRIIVRIFTWANTATRSVTRGITDIAPTMETAGTDGGTRERTTEAILAGAAVTTGTVTTVIELWSCLTAGETLGGHLGVSCGQLLFEISGR